MEVSAVTKCIMEGCGIVGVVPAGKPGHISMRGGPK